MRNLMTLGVLFLSCAVNAQVQSTGTPTTTQSSAPAVKSEQTSPSVTKKTIQKVDKLPARNVARKKAELPEVEEQTKPARIEP